MLADPIDCGLAYLPVLVMVLVDRENPTTCMYVLPSHTKPNRKFPAQTTAATCMRVWKHGGQPSHVHVHEMHACMQ